VSGPQPQPSPDAPTTVELGPIPDGAPELPLARARTAIAALLEAPPPWLELEAGIVDPQRMGQVPRGPTLVLGLGGSALGTRAVLAFAEVAGLAPARVEVLDAVDPRVVRPILDWAAGAQAKVMVVSKSARTVEVLALLEACVARGLEVATLISDPVDSAEAEAEAAPVRARIRASSPDCVELSIPPAVGGRWSVFTAVAQAPLWAAMLDPRLLVDGAIAARDRMRADPGAASSLASSLAWRWANPGPISILWCYSEILIHLAAWVQQLECESLGRLREDGSRVGELVCPLRGPADQHSVAQLLLHGPQHGRVSFLDFDGPSAAELEAHGTDPLIALTRLRIIEREATRESMTLPTRQLLIRDPGPATLGAVMLEHMFETAIAAEALGVSPYGQPAVELIKQGIYARM